ncbi:radical SAM protein [Arcobacter sp. FWKO B]|nr:radical SAM protein [Arcobacter sp. FWKO B]
MKFNHIYIELTTICGLNCFFCPPTNRKSHIMSLEMFDNISLEVKDFTDEIYLHIVGDPMVLSNLSEYIQIASKYDLKVNITTSGFYMDKTKYEILCAKNIKQINFSLNSFNANETNITFETYMDNILNFCIYKQSSPNNMFINLRLWNEDESKSASKYNERVFQKLKSFFGLERIDISGKKARVSNKVLLSFDEYFEWPNLNNTYYEPNGYCLGLKSHIAISSNGIVVPCCLDKDEVIVLGDLKKEKLKDILQNKKANDIINGFKKNTAVEELCKKCSYKSRFNSYGN